MPHYPVDRRAFLRGSLAAAAGLSLGPILTNSAQAAAPNDALWKMSASDLAAAIRDKEVSCREAVQAHLDRIDAVNGKINAVTVVLRDQALADADRADKALAAGGAIGPLHGVPMTVKENIDLEGSATTQGVVAMKDNLPSSDAPYIAQLKAAGAIPIGRTNLPDFALRWHTDNALWGATKNPWNANRTPGGSSGGEAAALATGMSPLGNGNDYGGSLRFPAQCCGICSLKPSRGRIAQGGGGGSGEPSITAQMMAVEGPMARHVRDLRLALSVMSGPDARDPRWTPAPLEGPPLKQPIRVAVAADPGKLGVHPDVAAGVAKAAKALESAGYAVEEADPPAVMQAAMLWRDLVVNEIRATVAGLFMQVASPDAKVFMQNILDAVPETDLRTYMNNLGAINGIARQWRQFSEKYPITLGPICTNPPFEPGFDLKPANVDPLVSSMRLVVTLNLLGLPAAAVTVGAANGLPQAVQLIGPIYREDLCLAAAQAVESALGVVTPIDPK